MTRQLSSLLVSLLLGSIVLFPGMARSQPIPIASVDRDDPISFENEILPLLQKNCLACHSASEPKGKLVLESPQTMLKGGRSGPSIVPGKGSDSLLIQLSARLDEPIMPPKDNKVGASYFTSQELGLIQRWIDQGATGVGQSSLLSPKRWVPLPAGEHPIYTTAISPDGQFVACGRSNQIFIYHVATGKLITRLTDPEFQAANKDNLPGLAHLDVIQSLRFNEQGDMLASGGFRTAKLWRSPRDVQRHLFKATAEASAVAVSSNRTRIAIGTTEGVIQLWSLTEPENEALTLTGHTAEIRSLHFTEDADRFVSASEDGTIRIWNAATGSLIGRIDTPTEVNSITTLSLPSTEPESTPEATEVIVSAGGDNLIRIWNLPRELTRTIPDVLEKSSVLATSPEGTLLALANPEGQVRIIDVASGAIAHDWSAHEGAVLDMAFGTVAVPEGADESDAPPVRRLATAGADGTVRVWELTGEMASKDAGAPELSSVLRGARVAIQSVDFHPNGQQLIAGAADGAVTLWNLESREEPTFPLPGETEERRAVSVLSPDGKRHAITRLVDDRPAIVVLDPATGKVTHTLLGHDASVTALAFNADATRLVSGSADGTARVWDLTEGKFPELARFTGHPDTVTAVAFSTDAQQVLSGSADNSLKLWKVADLEEVMDFVGHSAPIVAVAMSPNNQPISASADKSVRVWNASDGKVTRSQTEAEAVTAMSLSRDGTRIAVATSDHSIQVYTIADGKAQVAMVGHESTVHSLRFSPDNARIVSTSVDQSAKVWDVTDGRLLEIVPVTEKATSAHFLASSSDLLLPDTDARLRQQSLRFVGAFRGFEKPVTSVRFHPGGQLVLIGSEDGTVRGFNATTFQQAFSANHGAIVHQLALSRDGQRLASAGEDKLIRLWNATNGAALQPQQLAGFTAPVRSLDFSTDGNRMIGGSDAELLVFNLTTPTGGIEQTIIGHETPVISCRTLDPDGRAVSVSGDGTVLRWEMLGVRQLAGHSQPVTSVAALPSQPDQPARILSGSLDGTLRPWNIQTGQQLGQLNHGGPITCVEVRADGQRWASASANHTIKLWNATNNQQIAEMKGDLRAKALVAKLTRTKADADGKLQAAQTALEEAEKELPVKTKAEKDTATALAAADKDVEAKAATLTKASTEKSTAEQVAIEAAALAQKAALAMRNANDLAEKLKAQAADQAARANLAKATASADPTNEGLAKIAEEAMSMASKLDADAKAAEAAKATPKKAADDAAKAADAAAQKAIATNKPFTDAATALAEAQNVQRLAKQAHELATRELKDATEAVPATKKTLTEAEAQSQKVEAELAAAVEAEAAAQQPIHTLAFSPNDLTLASAGDSGVVHTWDAETGQAVSSYVGHEGAVRGIAFVSPDVLVSGSVDETAIAWELNPSWQLDRVIGSIDDPSTLVDRVTSVDFNSAGTMLATGSGIPSRSGEVKIWSVADGTLIREIDEPHTDTVNAVAFSPDDRFIATTSADKYVKMFDVETGELAGQFEGHTNYGLDVAWRGGGKFLASCGADGTVRIWNTETSERVRIIQGFSKQVSAVRFVAETQFMVIAAGDPIVRMYNSDNGGTQVNFGGPSEFMFCIDAAGDRTNGVVVAGGHDGILRIWRANGQQLHAIGVESQVAGP